MQYKKNLIGRLVLVASMSMVATMSQAQELRFMCSTDGNECEVIDDLVTRFEKDNPGVDVIVDTVPYKAILENLPVQLAAGSGPDIAKVTDLGGLSKYYMDI